MRAGFSGSGVWVVELSVVEPDDGVTSAKVIVAANAINAATEHTCMMRSMEI